jgi:hypothetical protein
MATLSNVTMTGTGNNPWLEVSFRVAFEGSKSYEDMLEEIGKSFIALAKNGTFYNTGENK